MFHRLVKASIGGMLPPVYDAKVEKLIVTGRSSQMTIPGAINTKGSIYSELRYIMLASSDQPLVKLIVEPGFGTTPLQQFKLHLVFSKDAAASRLNNNTCRYE